MASVVAILNSASRQGQFLGQDDLTDALTAKLHEWVNRYGMAMAASCGPGHLILPSLAIRFGHLLAISGAAQAAAAIQDSSPPSCPRRSRVPAVIVARAAP